MVKYVSLMIALVALSSISLFAQSSMSVGPQLGIYKSQDADNAKLMGGAALRLRIDQGFGIEGSINYREEEYNNGYLTAKSWPVMVTGLVYPLPVAYGAIGAGWYNTSVDYNYPPGYNGGPGMNSSDTEQKFGWHFGGGVEVPVGQVGKLVGDIRYVFLDYNFKTLPGTNGVNSDFYVITAGMQFGL